MPGPFRIRAAQAGAGPTAAAAAVAAPAPPSAPDEYLTRLVKLVPSEVVALYLTGLPLAKTWPGGWAFVCLILTGISRYFGTKDSAGAKGAQWTAVGVAAVSFVIWVYATGGNFFGLILPQDSGIAAIAVLIWTWAVPYFYKGD